MRRVLTMAVKDLVLTTRDLLGLFFIIGFPILMGLFFGSMYNNVGQKGGSSAITVAVVDEDSSPVSAEFVADLDDSDGVNLQKLPRDEATNRVRRGDLVGMIVLPKGFGETAGIPWLESPAIELGVDPSRQAEGAMLQGLVMKAAGKLTVGRLQPILTQLQSTVGAFLGWNQQTNAADDASTNSVDGESTATSPGFQLARIKTIDVTHEAAPGSREALVQQIRSRWDISFPQAMLWGVLGCAASFAISVVRERKQGTLLRLTAAPITRAQIILGKAAACFIAVLLVIAMLTALGVWLGMRPRSPALLAVASLCVAAAFVGVSILMSVIGRTEEAVSGAAWGLNMIMAMFGGGMIPLAFMPAIMVPLSQASPVKWSILALEGAIWRGFTWSEMLAPCAILLAVGGACLTLGAVRLSKMTD